MTKLCVTCGETKPLDEFHVQQGLPDGRKNKCKACCAAYAAAYYKAKHAEIRASQRRYRTDNLDQCKAIAKVSGAKYRASMREQERARARDYRALNADKVQAYTAARYAAHKDLLLGRVKASRAKNPTYYKAYIAAWKGANRSLRSAVQAKRNDAIAAGGAEVKQFVYKLLSQPNLTCEYCGVDVVGSAHVDHRVPLALGGAHAVDNLQILCPDCNTRKGAKPPDEFFVLLNTAKHFSIEGDLSWR